MSLRREMSFYFLTFMLFISSISFIIPNLSTNENSYKKLNKIIDSCRIDEEQYEDKYGNKKIKHTLVIITSDNNYFYISKSNLKNWDSISSLDLKRKKFEVLLRKTTDKTGNENPMGVKIDGKDIVTKNENIKSNYIILSLTIVCMFISFFLIRKRLKA